MKKLLAVSLCLLAADSPRDLDVLVTSGSPLDWLADLPRPIPTVDRTRLGGDAGRMTMVEEPPHVQATDVFSFARITTVDLIGEIPWTVRNRSETPAAYPPPVKDDILWLALSVVLRKLLHPAQVNDSEAFEYLTYLGEPSFAALDMAAGEKSLAEMRGEFRKYVTPIPKEKPEHDAGKDAAETMMLRLAYDDLVCAHPFSFDQRFAGRIALLGNEMVPYVIAASKSSHSFLARNAVVMLGRYDDAESLQRLRELLRTSLDACVRARCVDALVRRRDNGAEEVFVEMLAKTRERTFALSLIRGLGVLGARSSLRHILDWAQGKGDFDSTGTVLTALARLAPDKAEDREAVTRYLNAAKGRSFRDPEPVYTPVSADADDTREQIVAQLITMCRAAMKDAAAERELLGLVDQARRDLKDQPQDRRLVRGMLAKFHAPVIYALLQVLGRFERGREALLEIAGDKNEDIAVRVHALIELARANPPGLKDKIRPFAALTQEQPVAETAYRVLAALDGPTAAEVGKGLVDQYRRDMPLAKKAVVLVAIRFLASRKAITLEKLIEITELELMHRDEERRKGRPGGQDASGERRDFTSPVFFLEHLAVEIGRTGEAAAVGILSDILALPEGPGRGEAAIGIGSTRSPEGWPALLKALEDNDAWVRLMASRALKYSLGRDAPCDWLYGPADARAKAVAQVKAWIDEKKK